MPEGTPPSIAANITSHPTAGIGAWSDQEIARAITQGILRDGRALKPPMAFRFYAGLKDGDLAAIIATCARCRRCNDAIAKQTFHRLPRNCIVGGERANFVCQYQGMPPQ